MKNTYRGIVCEIGALPSCKAPLLAPTARRVLKTFERDRGPTTVRDRVLILLGLSGGYRVGELPSLCTEDVEFVDEGAVILLRRSKTDREGGGLYKGIPHGGHPETCPVTHLRGWLSVLGVAPGGAAAQEEGPIFCPVDRHGNVGANPMTPDSVSRVVKKRAKGAGLDPSRYSGHALRSGFVTGASEGGAHDADIMRQSAHRSL